MEIKICEEWEREFGKVLEIVKTFFKLGGSIKILENEDKVVLQVPSNFSEKSMLCKTVKKITEESYQKKKQNEIEVKQIQKEQERVA